VGASLWRALAMDESPTRRDENSLLWGRLATCGQIVNRSILARPGRVAATDVFESVAVVGPHAEPDLGVDRGKQALISRPPIVSSCNQPTSLKEIQPGRGTRFNLFNVSEGVTIGE